MTVQVGRRRRRREEMNQPAADAGAAPPAPRPARKPSTHSHCVEAADAGLAGPRDGTNNGTVLRAPGDRAPQVQALRLPCWGMGLLCGQRADLPDVKYVPTSNPIPATASQAGAALQKWEERHRAVRKHCGGHAPVEDAASQRAPARLSTTAPAASPGHLPMSAKPVSAKPVSAKPARTAALLS